MPQKMSSLHINAAADGDPRSEKEEQNLQDSGWCEVKKKNRSGAKFSAVKSTFTVKKPVELSVKAKNDGTAASKLPIISTVMHEGPPSLVKANLPNSENLGVGHEIRSEKLLAGTANDCLGVIEAAEYQLGANLIDTPKFKWGNLEDEDITENVLPGVQLEKHVENSFDSMLVGSEDSTILLGGGKQSSTKELNGLKCEDTRKPFLDYDQICDINTPCGFQDPDIVASCNKPDPTKSEFTEHTAEVNVCESSSIAEDINSLMHSHEEKDESPDEVTENISNQTDTSELSVDPSSSKMSTMTLKAKEQSPQQETMQSFLENANQNADGKRTSNERTLEFSVAASMLMERFEETESGESKERFRQRLWCYLFENLNRAIDELYFLCELECDMEQILEALLVFKEAGLDFSELKSRVEGFEKVKKQSPASQVLFAGNLGGTLGALGAFSGKVEHRRPHAIAWEVRRMACSPHRAEILSSSLEAFKKVQQIAAQKNTVSQTKRRDAAKLLEIEQSCKALPSKVVPPIYSHPNIKEAACIFEENQKVRAKSNRISSQVLQSGSEKTADNEVKDLCDPMQVVQSIGSRVPLAARGSNPARTVEFSLTCEGKVTELTPGKLALPLTGFGKGPTASTTVERGKFSEKRVSIVDNEREKKVPKTRSSLDAWKVKRNWEDVLSSPLKSSNRASRSPCAGWKSTDRVKVLHDKLMSPERKRKSPSEMKKEVDEKQARATRIRRELENERVQRLQRTTEKLNRVSEWQAVRSSKLREGMHARQQRGESRHEAHLAEIARRASDESIKVNEVRFITSLNEENKKLSLRQKLQDSELRRAERLQIIKIKQKEDIAREEAVLERRRLLEAERLQRIAETQRKKEEAKARRDEERKAASAAREARAVEQVRKKEVRAKAQQEEAELQAQKLTEKLRESELRRKVYLEQIRERAAMESREQASPSLRRPSSRDGNSRSASQGVSDSEANIEKDVPVSRQVSAGKGSNSGTGVPLVKSATMGLQHQTFKRRIKRIRQRLMAKKHEFIEPPNGAEGSGIGSITVAAAARSKIGRWLQDLHRLQQARKAGSSGVGFIIGEMVKYMDGKDAELHAARQAGLLDFVATALPASHTSKPEASQTTLSLLRILKVLLALPANRSYFIARNLLPPLIPMLSTALENFSSLDSASVVGTSLITASVNCTADRVAGDEKLDAVGEVLSGLLESVTLIMGHTCLDESQFSMKEDLAELIVACEVIHHLRDLFSLFDRPQIEGAPFPAPVLFGLNLLQSLTDPRGKPAGLPYDVRLNMMFEKQETAYKSISDNVAVASSSSDAIQTSTKASGGIALQEQFMVSSGSITQLTEVTSASGSIGLSDATLTAIKESNGEGLLMELVNSAPLVSPNIEMGAGQHVAENSKTSEKCLKYTDASEQTADSLQESLANTSAEGKTPEHKGERGQVQLSTPNDGRSAGFLVSAIAETGLVGLPSLLTAVLLQTNPRSSPDQAAAVLPSNFEEVATGVLKVLNNLARLDLGLVQSLLAMPDLQMEFFHLVSFLLSHCTCKWNTSTDQVASLLLETLLLLGYFALLHPGNQAVLRWGKSPTILHKICDLPFAFFSDPLLMPILVGTLLAICFGSEQNRDVVREELSMEMLLSLLKSCRSETAVLHKDKGSEDIQARNQSTVAAQGSQMSAIMEESEEEMQTLQANDSLTFKDDVKKVNGDSAGSDSDAISTARQQGALRSSISKPLTTDVVPSPGRKGNRVASKSAATTEGEPFAKEPSAGRGTSNKSQARVNSGSTILENGKKSKGASSPSITETSSKALSTNVGLTPSRKLPTPVTSDQSAERAADSDCYSCHPCLRSNFLLQNRFPTCLLDTAQDFFAVER